MQMAVNGHIRQKNSQKSFCCFLLCQQKYRATCHCGDKYLVSYDTTYYCLNFNLRNMSLIGGGATSVVYLLNKSIALKELA